MEVGFEDGYLFQVGLEYPEIGIEDVGQREGIM